MSELLSVMQLFMIINNFLSFPSMQLFLHLWRDHWTMYLSTRRHWWQMWSLWTRNFRLWSGHWLFPMQLWWNWYRKNECTVWCCNRAMSVFGELRNQEMLSVCSRVLQLSHLSEVRLFFRRCNWSQMWRKDWFMYLSGTFIAIYFLSHKMMCNYIAIEFELSLHFFTKKRLK